MTAYIESKESGKELENVGLDFGSVECNRKKDTNILPYLLPQT